MPTFMIRLVEDTGGIMKGGAATSVGFGRERHPLT